MPHATEGAQQACSHAGSCHTSSTQPSPGSAEEVNPTCVGQGGVSHNTSLAVPTTQTGLESPSKLAAPQEQPQSLDPHSPGLNTIPHVALSRPSPEPKGARKTWYPPCPGPCPCPQVVDRQAPTGAATILAIQLGPVRPGLGPCATWACAPCVMVGGWVGAEPCLHRTVTVDAKMA